MFIHGTICSATSIRSIILVPKKFRTGKFEAESSNCETAAPFRVWKIFHLPTNKPYPLSRKSVLVSRRHQVSFSLSKTNILSLSPSKNCQDATLFVYTASLALASNAAALLTRGEGNKAAALEATHAFEEWPDAALQNPWRHVTRVAFLLIRHLLLRSFETIQKLATCCRTQCWAENRPRWHVTRGSTFRDTVLRGKSLLQVDPCNTAFRRPTTMLAVVAFVCMHHATSANKYQQLSTLLG